MTKSQIIDYIIDETSRIELLSEEVCTQDHEAFLEKLFVHRELVRRR